MAKLLVQLFRGSGISRCCFFFRVEVTNHAALVPLADACHSRLGTSVWSFRHTLEARRVRAALRRIEDVLALRGHVQIFRSAKSGYVRMGGRLMWTSPAKVEDFSDSFLRIRGAEMGINSGGKRRVFDDAFRREAVRILASSDRTIRQVAGDLGVGVSSLGKWKRHYDEAALLAGPHDDVSQELARLRRENELLRAERDLLKKRPPSLPRRQVDEFCVDRCKEG
jgi:transposase